MMRFYESETYLTYQQEAVASASSSLHIMASLPKGDTKAEVKNQTKEEPKEQREPKKATEKPTTPTASPVTARKENPANNAANQPKSPQPKSPDKKEASSPVKKENSAPPKNQETPKSPELKNKEKPEKKDSSAGEKANAQKVAVQKPSSPTEKNAALKAQSEKAPSSSGVSAPTVSQEPANTPTLTKIESPSKVGNGSQNTKPSNDKQGNNDAQSTKKDEKSADNAIKPDNGNESKKINNEVIKDSTLLDVENKTKPEPPKDEKPVTKSTTEEKVVSSSEENTENSTKTSNKTDTEKVEQSNDKNNNEPKKDNGTVIASPTKNGKHATKTQLRTEIWNKMFRSSMLAFRKPCNYRIPHFKGDVISAGRLSTLEIFQKAKVVKVSLDKAHECVRLQVIEAGKEMIVGCPGLREAVFLHVKPPMEPSKSSNRLASSRIGIGHVGTALDFSSGTQADLVIVGSVAVDRTGLRVGKGEGFADLEYALLKKLGGIAPDAPIVTVVHDSQVYDTLPETLFKEHDVPADYIVTPTEVIEISPKRKHPDLIWNILSNRRINSIPIIKQLLDREKNRDGAEISLKDEDTDSEELEQIAKRKRYFMRRRSYSAGSPRGMGQMVNRYYNQNRGNNMNMNMNMRGGFRTRRYTAPSERTFQQPIMMMMQRDSPARTFRSRAASMSNYNYPPQNMNQNPNWGSRNFRNGSRRRNNRHQMLRPKYSVDFSLKVHGLTNEIRVRDLKAAVNQRGIRPRDISWLPHKGVAFLHFVKHKNNKQETEQTTTPFVDTDSILASLRDLTVKGENGPETNVKVEAAQPFRRVHFTV